MPDSSERILLTGAAGFIGSHTAERLLAAGCTVIGVDNLDGFYDPAIKRRNLAEIGRHDGAARFTCIEADLCDAAAMARVFDEHKPTGVIHLAARAGVRPSIEQPALYAHVNVEGTTVMLEAARRTKGCSRFVMASSSSVYGNNPKVPFSESDDVNAPISPYAATKRSCELIAHTYAHLYKLPVASLRFFTVFGPRQRPDLAIGKFIRLISAGESIPFFGDGSTSRDYTFIQDIVTGVVAAYDRIPDHGYRIWNLGGSDPVTLREMVDTIGRVVGKTPILDRQPLQPGDVERTFADLSRSTAELSFRPTTSFQDGVRTQWDWFRNLA